MEKSQIYPSHGYAVPSPCGTYIASLSQSQDHIYVQWTASLFPAFTFTLQSGSGNAYPAPKSDINTLQWTTDSTSLLLIGAQDVRLFSLTDTAIKRRISNGTGGLGNIIAAQVVGEHLIVAWEFGNLQQWNISSGRASECGHVRIDANGRPMWALRSTIPKVFVTLTMKNGLEVLEFRLAAQAQPFKTLNAQSHDTKSMAWSKDGRWLATLDSCVATQSAHIYTADGHLFRSYPPIERGSGSNSLPQTGFTTLRWSKTNLFLASPRRPTVMLDASTLSHKHTLAAGSCPDLSGWQEEPITDGTSRSFRFVSRSGISTANIITEASDIEINANGTLLAAWSHERNASSLTIWDVPVRIPCAVLMTQSPIRSVSWHPGRWDTILVLCRDGSLRVWSLSSAEAPLSLACPVPSTAEAARVQVQWAVSSDLSAAEQTGPAHDAILITDRKTGWTLVWPNGRPPAKTPVLSTLPEKQDTTENEDSLFDILSGKKPLPGLVVQMQDGEETTSIAEDDTFDMIKHRPPMRISTGSSEMF